MENVVDRSVRNRQEEIFDLIREQLSGNKDGKGSNIGSYATTYGGSGGGYSGYASFPKDANKGYNMNWSGRLFDDFSLKYENQILIIYNSRADELIGKGYDSSIAHLNEENKNRMFNFVQNDFDEWVKDL